MIKKNIHIGFTLTIASALILLFQNCGQSNPGQAPVANGRVVLDDFLIVDSDCSSEDTCKVTVAKTKTSPYKGNPPPSKDIPPKGRSGSSSDIYPAVEYDFSPNSKLAISDEEVPNEFFTENPETGAYTKCVLVNRRDDIRYEYLCAK